MSDPTELLLIACAEATFWYYLERLRREPARG